MKTSSFALAAALALLVAASSATRAGELVVIASTDAEIGIGSLLDGSRAIQLAEGNSITLVSADGRTLKLRGPYLGRPDPVLSTGGNDLLEALSAIVKPTERDVSAAGIMRSSLYAPKQPWVIDSGQSGAHCLLPGRPVLLWRPMAIGAASATLKADGGQAPGQAGVTWRDGSYTAPWPAAVALADGATYRLEFAVTGTTRRLSIHQVPGALDSDVSRAVWMHENGCTAQARALLGTLS
jgi:hypothetical protein